MLGRFTRPDPANSFSLFNPQSLNRYSYTFNNPVNLIDPNGLFPFKTILWDGVKAGWGWASHIVPKHVTGKIPGGTRFASEAIARAATRATIAAPDKVSRQGLNRWLLQKAIPGAGLQGQGVVRVALEDLGGGTAALVTSHAANIFKGLFFLGIGIDWVTDPWHSAEAAGLDMEEEWVAAQVAANPAMFTAFDYGTDSGTLRRADQQAVRARFFRRFAEADSGSASVEVTTCIQKPGDPPCPR